MDATFRSELEALAKGARSLHEDAGKLVDRLDAMLRDAPQAADDTDTLKRADGRMTDAGIAAINTAFDAGATVTEVATRFGITVSAASNRRKIWLVGKSGAA